MTNEKVDLIFRGELVPGAELSQVKQNLARLFKMDLTRIDALFAGKPVVLKRGMDMDAAAKYRVAIKKAGARIETRASREPDAAAVSRAPASPASKATFTAQETSSAASSHVTAPPSATVQGNAAQENSLSLAPMRGELLRADEKRRVAAVAVDTSALSLRPAGEALVDDSEIARPEPVHVGTEALDVAPVGADILKADERRVEPEVELDLSAFSVAPRGDRLQAPAQASPPPPDVSRLSLVDDPR